MDICWLEQSECDVPSGDWWLSESERGLLESMRIPKRRADWRLGRWTAKQGISAYLSLPRIQRVLAAVELRPAPSGSPEVFLHGRAAPLQLSLSHSRGVGLCAIAPAETGVGCDLETVEPRTPVFVADYFTAQEQELVAETPVAERDQVLTLLWSIKESALKVLRCGLRADTRSVNTAPGGLLRPDGEDWRPVSAAHIGGMKFCGWWRVSRDLVRTIVADRAPVRLIALQPGAQGRGPVSQKVTDQELRP
jgi:4'-phosphopantetheinyl transferase